MTSGWLGDGVKVAMCQTTGSSLADNENSASLNLKTQGYWQDRSVVVKCVGEQRLELRGLVSGKFDMEQYEALTVGCGMTVLPLSITRVAGEDRARFLHNFCTADIKKLESGDCCEAFFLNTKGKTICHAVIVARDIDMLIVSTARSSESLIENLDRYLLSDDVQLQDVSELWRSVFVRGAQAESAFESCKFSLPREGTASNTGFQIVLRAELAGEGILVLEAEDGDVTIAGSLADAGAINCSADWFHHVRIESVTAWCDSEITETCLPQEFRRDEKTISFTKGCYLGQETVARLDALGHVNRYLTGFEILDGSIETGADLVLEGKKVGRITSISELGDQNSIALGFVRVAHSKPGNVLKCEGVTVKVS